MEHNLPVEFHPEAFAELERAKVWYDGQRPKEVKLTAVRLLRQASSETLHSVRWGCGIGNAKIQAALETHPRRGTTSGGYSTVQDRVMTPIHL